ncbi:MAG TPA: hypothetical protein VLF41_02820 [Candidatus Nanoarchaeia archaeon]|nr:hypothetical protein [Candidatus Nanoarchaeia archaeon]
MSAYAECGRCSALYSLVHPVEDIEDLKNDPVFAVDWPYSNCLRCLVEHRLKGEVTTFSPELIEECTIRFDCDQQLVQRVIDCVAAGHQTTGALECPDCFSAAIKQAASTN